jgi:hypothetical protein
MTTPINLEIDESLITNPLSAALLAGLIEQAQVISNDILDMQEEDLQFWKLRYIKLFEDIVVASKTITSPEIERILDAAAPVAGFAADSLT